MTPARISLLGAALAVALAMPPAALAAAQTLADGVFVVPEPSAAARAWDRYRDLIWIGKQAVTLALPAWLLFSGAGARLRTRLDRHTGGRRLLTATLFAGLYAVLFSAATLSVSAIGRLLAGPLGVEVPSWGEWASVQAGSAWPLVAGALVLGWAPWWLFARSPRFWPGWSSAVLIVAGAAMLVAQPLGLELRPLTDARAQAAISELAAHAGAPTPRVALLVTDPSDPCAGAMGTVKGLGPTKVLVLGSAFLQTRPERQVRSVIAHELKHYTRNDDWKALYALAALVVGGTGALALGGALALRLGAGRLGFDSLADPASLPLLALLLGIFSLAGGAAFHRYGHHVEHEADRFALELTRDNAGAAALMQHDLSCTRWRNPDATWIQRTFRQNHPSLRSRIEFARTYRPWERGEKETYAGGFR